MTERGYSITGKVILKETGAGIADVLVVLFELEPRTLSRDASLARGTTSGDPIGRRLGSTMTDVGGRFRFVFGEHACSRVDPCRGPDLFVCAVSPNDEEDRATDRNGQSPYLAISRIAGAGHEEAVVLRVATAKLREAGVPLPTEESRQAAIAERVTATLASSTALHDAIDRQREKGAANRLARALAPRQRAATALQKLTLSKFGADVRESARYVEHRKPVAEKQQQVVAARMKEIPKSLEKSPSKKVGILLHDEMIKKWGLPLGPNGDLDPNLPFFRVVEHLKKLIGSGPLERSRSWLEIACAEKEAKEAVLATIERCTRPGADSGQPPVGPDVAPVLDVSAAQLVRSEVEKQLAHSAAPEVELKYGVPNADGTLTATITKSGPADVIAYHDFHDLQIAFEHVWSEAFDAKIPKLFRDVYAEMVKFSNQASGVPLPSNVATVSDMKDLYAEFRSMVDLVESGAAPPATVAEPPPPVVQKVLPQITAAEWSDADASSQARLIQLGNAWADAEDDNPVEEAAKWIVNGRHDRGDRMRHAREEALLVYEKIKAGRSAPKTPDKSPSPTAGSDRLRRLFDELDARLAEPYRFDVFAADSVNFGIMLTYRQKWVPLDYQVGSLVSTIPLGPKEVRRYSSKTVIKKTRSERELVDQEQASRSERGSTSRADSEIVKQARDKTSFETTASGTIDVGVFKGEFGTKFGVDSEKASSDTKKNFREAVLKAADEFRRKRVTEVTVTSSEEVETVSSGELVNPNDEITVTYLFYELQRQYEISEHLHRLTPVVLVANDVPRPDEVDEDWLIAHQWVLGRALLDEGLRPSLQYLASTVAGDQLALEALRMNVERQVAIVEETTRQAQTKTKLSEKAFDELRLLVRRAGSAEEAQKLEKIAMAMFLGPIAMAGGTGSDDAAKRQEDIAKMALDRADQGAQQVTAKLTTEISALQEAVDKYVKALREYFERATGIAALRIHVKQNILYYMQAIWDHEPPDQRYFRLYEVPVPWIEASSGGSITASAMQRRPTGYRFEMFLPLEQQNEPRYRQTTKKLAEIADLDNLLGYKGNYMIFPAKEASYLHLYMMQDYLDETGALRDPDGTGTMSSREILDAICCLQKHAPEIVEARRAELEEMLAARTAGPRRESELVVVPTDSLYIEALPGAHPVMEQFKRVHRALDVKKVQSEVRRGELENVRLAARLLAGEHEDPDIEKVIQVRQGDGVDVNT